MKKPLLTALILIIVLASCLPCFGVSYVIDSFTGEVIESDDESAVTTSNIVKLSPDTAYQKTSGMFVFYVGQRAEDCVYSSVYEGEYTTEEVEIRSSGSIGLNVYLDGELLETGEKLQLTQPGGYTIRTVDSDALVCRFHILRENFGELTYIQLPDVYFLTGVKVNGNSRTVTDMTRIDLSAEGEYDISLLNLCDNTVKEMHFTVDHIAPVLEIIGVTDGEAKNAVSFGPLEEGSSLHITRDGEDIEAEDEYKTAGNYTVEYFDAAGNSSVYEFTIHMFLDISGWVLLGIFGAVIIAAAVYIIYKHNHLKVA